MKMIPGARLGIAVAIAGEVFSIPNNMRIWNVVTLERKINIISFRKIFIALCHLTNSVKLLKALKF